MYCESHWISCDVYDTFKRSYLRMSRSGFNSHHMPILLLFLPLQRYEILEGGPPCKSMPLVRLGLTFCSMLSITSSAALYKIMLLFGFAAPVNLKVREVKCVPGDPGTMCPVLFKGSHSLLLLA